MAVRVFPVAGAHHYTDDWGTPRSGGRTHQGNDIFGAKGTPLVAVDDGYLTDATNALGGVSLNLKSRTDMARYYYAHLDSVEGSLPRNVNAGDVIGYLGDSGNAKGTSPHLHFEVHPLGGAAVDPYPYLKAAESGVIYKPPPKTSPWMGAFAIVATAGLAAFVIRSRV